MPAKKPTKTAAKKPPEPKEPSNAAKIKALQDRINKRYKGRGQLKRGDEYILPYYMLRRPSGIIDLDIATGGGLPAGGLCEIIGPEGACKSYLLNLYLRRQQIIFGKKFTGAMCMTEMHFDKLYAKTTCGLRIAFHPDEIAREEELMGRKLDADELAWLTDEIGHFQEAFGDCAEVLYDILLDIIESSLYGIVGIDSWGSMLTMQETKKGKGMKDKVRGGSAKVNAEFMRRFSATMMGVSGGPVMTTVIGINQMRDSMDPNKYMETQGGWALKHGKFVAIKLQPGPAIWRNAAGEIETGASESKSKREKVGKVIYWAITKGKAGCHDGPSGEFWYFYATGVDTVRALMVAAEKCAAVNASGAWFDFDGLKVQGRNKFIDALRDDPVRQEKLEAEVFRAHNITPKYR